MKKNKKKLVPLLSYDKKDYSYRCNLDDDDLYNPCWNCTLFYFPLGCMKGED